uniref:Uncharacterized protein n=1 Tax=Sphaerodactylus townsendi TaxID=933632 RepID=A0ACB8G992_9SAUR
MLAVLTEHIVGHLFPHLCYCPEDDFMHRTSCVSSITLLVDSVVTLPHHFPKRLFLHHGIIHCNRIKTREASSWDFALGAEEIHIQINCSVLINCISSINLSIHFSPSRSYRKRVRGFSQQEIWNGTVHNPEHFGMKIF